MKYLTKEEAHLLPPGQPFVFDVEIYQNFLFIAFEHVEKEECVIFWCDEHYTLDTKNLAYFIHKHLLIGFNSESFDIPIITYALSGANCEALKKACDRIIRDNLRSYNFYKSFKLEDQKPKVNHIDVMNVCPRTGAYASSLKQYGARLHAKSIQELPVDHQALLTQEDKANIGQYCLNDLKLTKMVYKALEEQIELRKSMGYQYEMDLRSYSDPKIAEEVIKKEMLVRGITKGDKNPRPGQSYEYDAPSWIGFGSDECKVIFEEIKESDFIVGDCGSIALPKNLSSAKVRINKAVYKLGIGGIHSQESCQTVVPKEGEFLVDVDVASYYPAIILNNGFYPENIGPEFLEVYRAIVDRRLAAKRSGNKADSESLKIVINGTYGKFGNKWSTVYSPKLLIQVTLTGQLAMLMLIEFCEANCIQVVSANTDGLVFHCKSQEQLDLLKHIIKLWEKQTKFETEETYYNLLASRDVNNYIAIKTDGTIKSKGCYSIPSGMEVFKKNPDCFIVNKAVRRYLAHNVPLESTIMESQDISDFVVVKRVTGGAEFVQKPLGKTVRWYYSRHSDNYIEYAKGDKKGNKVGSSDGAMPVEVLPDYLPEDLDYAKYLEMAEAALYDLGVKAHEDPQCKIFTEDELDKVQAMQ